MRLILQRALGVSLLLSVPMFAQDVRSTVGRYSEATIGDAVSAEQLTLTSGRLKLTLLKGSAAPISAGKETFGLFLKGSGTFEYSLSEAIELPAVKMVLKNANAAAKYNGTDTSGTITGTFTEVFWGGPAPTLTGAPAASLAEAFKSNREDYGRFQGRPAAHLLAMKALNLPGGKSIRAEFRGEGEWLYEYDDVVSRTESLLHLFMTPEDEPSRKLERYALTVSEAPIGFSRRDVPPVPFALTKLDYEVVASDGKDVTINTRQTFTPSVSAARVVSLYLASREIVDTKAPRHLRVKAVTTAEGKPLSFVHASDEILVELPEPSQAGKSVELRFNMEGDVLARPGNSSHWRLLRWYPVPPLAGEVATVHGVVKVKAPFVPFIGGKTISRRSENGYNVVEAAIDTPTDFTVIAAGKFFPFEEKRGNLTIRVASYAMANPRAAKILTDLAFAMIKEYEFFLGPFPVDELNIIEMNSYGWGQAPAGLVFITSEAFNPIGDYFGELYSEGINERLAHEIAHQYWGTGVRMASYDEQWITESFAEYSAGLLLKRMQNEAVYKRLVNRWRAQGAVAAKTAPIPLANRVDPIYDWPHNRVNLLYNKGPYLLAVLHKQVGDEKFLTFLKSFQKSFHYKFGLTKDVEGLLGFITKQDFKPFFDQYYWGTAMPEMK